jgi:type I restriction enzyme M protein
VANGSAQIVQKLWSYCEDPACGTGGFLLATHDYIAGHYEMDRDQKRHLRYDSLRGVELVDGVTRLCAMNLYLHGIGPDDGGHEPPVRTDDALRAEPGEHADVVMTNPPFGKKSSITIVNEEGETDRQTLTYNRADFWTTTSNKQLNFVQHVKNLLTVNGRAAIVVPDNVLFEGGAGETVRRRLLHECDVHTLLRLPTGIFYAQGVKANVLFFDRKPGSETPWTRTVWVYDLRTNKHFTMKERPMGRPDLDEFVRCYRPGDRYNRVATWSEKTPDGRWRSYTYEEILARDKVSLDLFWLRDESLEDAADLPEPHVLAAEIGADRRRPGRPSAAGEGLVQEALRRFGLRPNRVV